MGKTQCRVARRTRWNPFCAENTRVLFFLSAVRTGTSRDSSVRPATVPWFRPLVASLTAGTQVRIPSKFMCGMRWTKWHWCRLYLVIIIRPIPHNIFILLLPKYKMVKRGIFQSNAVWHRGALPRKVLPLWFFCPSITPWTWKVTIIVENFNLAQGVQKRNQTGKAKSIKIFVHAAECEPPPLNMKAFMYSQTYFNKYWRQMCGWPCIVIPCG